MGAYWLLWFLSAVKQWLSGVIAGELAAVYAAQEASDAEGVAEAGVVSVAEVSRIVYAYVRVAAYMAWWGQVLFMRVQAAQHGSRLTYTPSMRGIPPRLVENVVREELRLVDGRINAPLDDVTERVTERLVSIVPSVARRTAVYAVEDTRQEREKAFIHSLENGSPVGRFLETVYGESTDNPVRSVLDKEPPLRQLLDETLLEFNTVYDKYKNDPFTVQPDMIAGWRELKPNLTPEEIDVFAQAWKCAALAEIELADDVPERIHPNTWYYEWRYNYSTEKAEYVVPPNNKVFEWLKFTGELGSHTEPKYYTAEQYRERAVEIVQGLPDTFFIEQNLRWARVPTGDYTCAFCLVLASRGAVYHSSETAHLNGFDHDHCDCLVVPVYDEGDYPFKTVVDAVQQLYRDYKDDFQIQYSRNLHQATIARGKNKGKKVWRHNTYINVPRKRLAEITKGLPRVDARAYESWENARWNDAL